MRNIEEYTLNYDSSSWEMLYQVKYRRKKVLESIQRYGGGKILEIGCGMDTLANYLNDFSHFAIVEPSRHFLQKARNDTLRKDRITYISGLFEESIEKLNGLVFDWIICSSLLHEIENPKRMLHAIFKVCNEESIVHINVPNCNSFHRLLAVESGFIEEPKMLSDRNRLLKQHNIFDMDSLKRLIFDVAKHYHMYVELLDEGSFFVKPFTHNQMEIALTTGILNEQIIDGLDKMIKYMPDLGSEIYLNFRVRG